MQQEMKNKFATQQRVILSYFVNGLLRKIHDSSPGQATWFKESVHVCDSMVG